MNWRYLLFLLFIAAAGTGAWWYWQNERESEPVSVAYHAVFDKNPNLTAGAAVASSGFPIGTVAGAELTEGDAVVLTLDIGTNYTHLITDRIYVVSDNGLLHIEKISDEGGQPLTAGARIPGFNSRLKAGAWKTGQWIKEKYESTRDYADDVYREHFGKKSEPDQG